jgi:hypothetical protein
VVDLSAPPIPAPHRTPAAPRGWRIAQRLVWLLSVGVLAALVLAPRFGLRLFWNAVIPLVPALLLLAPGVWRNVCPLATTALWAERAGLASPATASPPRRGALLLAAVAALLSLVPLRRVLLDTSGLATASTLVALSAVALLVGARHARKSGWCSGLCPVHPVELLYGSRPLLSVANARCPTCVRCSAPCPDTAPGHHPLAAARGRAEALAGTLITGGFPGFVFGWFQVSDAAAVTARAVLVAYAWPFGGLAVTSAVFLVARRLSPPRHARTLARAFAAAAVACYYGFRVPALFGFGRFAGDGLLVDLRAHLPAWSPIASAVVTVALLACWVVAREERPRPWSGPCRGRAAAALRARA